MFRVALWGVQLLLALMFFGAGVFKTLTPIDELAATMPWVGYSPAWIVRLVGISEVLGGIGLVLPAATRLLPFLTPLAAAGLVTIMVLAAGMHGTHGELEGIPVNVVLGGLALFVAVGRSVPAGRIAPRSVGAEPLTRGAAR